MAVLSGPSFARDIAQDHPVGVTLACADRAVGERLAHTIGTARFRTYLSDDVIGALVGGALKSVVAIACGVALGRKLGESTRATLFARGLVEMARLGVALGEGRKLEDVLRERVTVQEGVHSAESVAVLARRHNVDMPIVSAVDRVLNHGAGIDQAVAGLLAHPYHFDLPADR